MKETLYIDAEKLKNGQMGVVIMDDDGKSVDVTFAGVSIVSLDVTEEEQSIYQMISQILGVNFIFEEDIPKIPFYSVPQLFVFATEEEGGFFASMKREPAMNELNTPIYYIDGKNRPYKIGKNLKEFLQRTLYDLKWTPNLLDKKVKSQPIKNMDRERQKLIDLLSLEIKREPYTIKIEEKDTLILYDSYEQAAKAHDFIPLNNLFKG